MFRTALLDKETFCVTWELVPGRGGGGQRQDDLIKSAEEAARSGKIHGIGITDNPSGMPALSSEFVALQVKNLGIDPLVHFACRDKNRNEMESMLYALGRGGVENLLVLSGDYPTDGGFGTAKPVFDLDPIHLLGLLSRMNGGLSYPYMGKTVMLPPADFFPGVAFSPYKKTEPEVMGQYLKLTKKLNAGARFIITQVGYDARKLHELLWWMKEEGRQIPVIANVYILTYGAARTMNAGRIPGCVVTDKLLSEIVREKDSPDKGMASAIERAAKQYAVAKGLGCAGVHIGGHGIGCPTVLEIIERGEALSREWEKYVPEFDYPQDGGFYLYIKNEKNGLNTKTKTPNKRRSCRPPIYHFSRLVHSVIFEPRSPFFYIARPMARIVDSLRALKRIVTSAEYTTKALLFECQNCGDCALFDVAYLCPMSQCPKGQRNGPCGGSTGGWCEVYPGQKRCVWVNVYKRYGSIGVERIVGENIVPPCDWGLWQTSSWLNYFLGRDHLGKRLMGDKKGEEGNSSKK